jgi:hypothetical protein
LISAGNAACASGSISTIGRVLDKPPILARLSHSAYGSFLVFFAPSGLTGKGSSGSNMLIRRAVRG